MLEKRAISKLKAKLTSLSPNSFLNKLNGDLLNTLMRRKSKYSKQKKSFMLPNPWWVSSINNINSSPQGGNRFMKISPQIREGSMSTSKRMTKRNTKFVMLSHKLNLLS